MSSSCIHNANVTPRNAEPAWKIAEWKQRNREQEGKDERKEREARKKRWEEQEERVQKQRRDDARATERKTEKKD